MDVDLTGRCWEERISTKQCSPDVVPCAGRLHLKANFKTVDNDCLSIVSIEDYAAGKQLGACEHSLGIPTPILDSRDPQCLSGDAQIYAK